MLYQCVFCNRVWCSQDKYETLDIPNLDLENRNDVSHGICPECFQKQQQGLVHKHQRANGYDRCFNKNDNCNNDSCLFRPCCGRTAINNWRQNVVILTG